MAAFGGCQKGIGYDAHDAPSKKKDIGSSLFPTQNKSNEIDDFPFTVILCHVLPAVRNVSTRVTPTRLRLRLEVDWDRIGIADWQ